MHEAGFAATPELRVYTATVRTTRRVGDFTPRIVPYHHDARLPAECPLVVWRHRTGQAAFAAKLVDDMLLRVSIILLGAGIPLPGPGASQPGGHIGLELTRSKDYGDGVALLHCRVKG